MHPLAFDKDGQRFSFLPQAVALLVRRWRNPGGRGTCEQVFDEDGNPLKIPVPSTVSELRDGVAYVAGLYRLDQLGEDGEIIVGAPPAYVAIDPTRNAGLSGGADPLLVVRDMAQFNADVTKTIANSAAGMMNAATENMRAAIGGGLGNRRLLALLGKAQEELDDGDDGDDEGDDLVRDAGQPPAPPPPAADPWAFLAGFAPLLKPMLPKLGEAIGVKLADLLNSFMGPRPAAASGSTGATASATASGPASSGTTASEAAAGTGASGPPPPSSSPSSAPTPPPTAAPSAEASHVDPITTDSSAAPVAAPTEPATGLATANGASVALGDVRNAAPTGAQVAHLLAIRAVLTEREVAIVDGAIARMDLPTRAGWLAELSALTVDQAAARVRSMMPAASKKDAGGASR